MQKGFSSDGFKNELVEMANKLFELAIADLIFVAAWEARGGGSWTSPYPGLFRTCPVRGALMCPPTPSRNGRASFY